MVPNNIERIKMTFNIIKKTIKPLKKVKRLKITGTDGNAFALMGRALAHNRKYGIYSKEDFNLITNECTSGNYDHLLATLMHFFEAY